MVRTTMLGVAVLFSLLSATGEARAQGYPPPPPPPPGYGAPPPPPGYYAEPPPPPGRQGFYIGFSLGMGGLQFTDDVSESDRETGFSASLLRIGGALSPRFLLGANLGGWGKTFDDFGGEVTVTMVRINLEGTYYPLINPQGVDVYLRGGLGAAQFAISDENGDELLSEDGASFQVGAGIEKKLGRSFHLGFGLDWHFATLTEDVNANYWEAAVAFMWY